MVNLKNKSIGDSSSSTNYLVFLYPSTSVSWSWFGTITIYNEKEARETKFGTWFISSVQEVPSTCTQAPSAQYTTNHSVVSIQTLAFGRSFLALLFLQLGGLLKQQRASYICLSERVRGFYGTSLTVPIRFLEFLTHHLGCCHDHGVHCAPDASHAKPTPHHLSFWLYTYSFSLSSIVRLKTYIGLYHIAGEIDADPSNSIDNAS